SRVPDVGFGCVRGRVLRKLVMRMRKIAATLASADPTDKAEIYAALGVRVVFDPAERLVRASAGACTVSCVGEGT
ncbi:MAG TPA: hypothetical protein VMV14_08590, partial [Acidimicrobiales bacterium]|nr:hypothetical protein [Acidimicrobiales bacterium]